MRVYRDFFSYRHGIYKHSAASRAEASGFHSVRLVGWGEEFTGYSLTKYWVSSDLSSTPLSDRFHLLFCSQIAANSWGSWWGENGFFRIVRGENECEIENYVLATWPHAYLPPKKSSKTPRRPFY